VAKMAHRLGTKKGRLLYGLRKQTVEPVFGIIKRVMGWSQMSTVPGLRTSIGEGDKTGPLVAPGQLLIPELIAKGFKVKVGDTVVLVATNRDGSVNGKNFTVRGVLEQVTGPGGRDGYLHSDDARELLRMDDGPQAHKCLALDRRADVDAADGDLTRARAAQAVQLGR